MKNAPTMFSTNSLPVQLLQNRVILTLKMFLIMPSSPSSIWSFQRWLLWLTCEWQCRPLASNPNTFHLFLPFSLPYCYYEDDRWVITTTTMFFLYWFLYLFITVATTTTPGLGGSQGAATTGTAAITKTTTTSDDSQLGQMTRHVVWPQPGIFCLLFYFIFTNIYLYIISTYKDMTTCYDGGEGLKLGK